MCGERSGGKKNGKEWRIGEKSNHFIAEGTLAQMLKPASQVHGPESGQLGVGCS